MPRGRKGKAGNLEIVNRDCAGSSRVAQAPPMAAMSARRSQTFIGVGHRDRPRTRVPRPHDGHAGGGTPRAGHGGIRAPAREPHLLQP